MGAPYSLDLRERVVAAVAGGMSRAEAARRFEVSHSSAIRWTQRATATGSPAALPMGGKKPFALADEAEWIRARLAEKPDITGRELLAELIQRGVTVSYYGVWHFLDHIGLSFKKSLRASEQDRADVARRRRQWKQRQGKISATRLVFVDETWAKTNMTRLHGRCPRGQRLIAKVPHGPRKTLTFVAGLRCDGFTAPCVFDGPIDGETPVPHCHQHGQPHHSPAQDERPAPPALLLRSRCHTSKRSNDRPRPPRRRPNPRSALMRGTAAVKESAPRAASRACRRTRNASRSAWPVDDRAASAPKRVQITKLIPSKMSVVEIDAT